MKSKILVTGAGGFIGHHLVTYLKQNNFWVRGVDLEYPEFAKSDADEFQILDLREWENCVKATNGISEVYNLAADMGGIGYITSHNASIARNNILINTHMLEASRLAKVEMFFFSSSACIYPTYKQVDSDAISLRESDAYPADPEEGYGWEKLYTEKLCEYYLHDYNLKTIVARFHNVYGPLGTFQGGKEKAPAAICRKISQAKSGDIIDIWGDGMQTRSFMYIDDCVEGIARLVKSGNPGPLNLGMDSLVTINEMVSIVTEISGKKIKRAYQMDKPQGVRGRNSDNTLLKHILGWSPSTTLKEGLTTTYEWIDAQIYDQK
tara:strand:- start:2245 stop:3207 length:963 start_codon:yes stop_codon:yes gene_type:complete